ncbi:type VI immunity family protein [Actinoplanes sp. NBRC 103695]|uniref:type VI immunity family protein n=1 Tax=Actinoplanes sp. NBRC 103695 TaxID=3032202 RepID=UPI0025554C78|nr:type VI immunity family protein [Actinoplanes sp. NBRC 103695]
MVRLNLVLYLGAYPSPAEVLACFRAFRRHFPVAGTMRWELPNRFGSYPTTADGPDDESWADRMRVETGMFGIRLSVGDYTLNVCGIPASDDGAERASFCEVIVPADADHEQLARLADDLVAVLPVRSGHGGFSAYASKRGPEPYNQVFAWCQRFFAIDVGSVDGFLEATSRRVLGAGWLTVLGPTFTQYLTEHTAPQFEASGIDIRRIPHGLIIRAGDAPTLGDIQRGEFPTLMADVDQFLQPLKANSWHRTSMMSIGGGHWWSVQTHDLPGAFTEHRATAAWLARFADPAAFLAARALPADPPT